MNLPIHAGLQLCVLWFRGSYLYFHKKCPEHLPNYDFLQKKGSPDGGPVGGPDGGSRRGPVGGPEGVQMGVQKGSR